MDRREPTDAEIASVSYAIQRLMPGWLAENGTVDDADLARAAIIALDEVRGK